MSARTSSITHAAFAVWPTEIALTLTEIALTLNYEHVYSLLVVDPSLPVKTVQQLVAQM